MSHPIKKLNITALLSLAVAMLLWCTVPLFLRSFIHEIDAFTANGTRYPFSAVLWIIPFVLLYRSGKVDPKVFRLAIIPVIINVAAQTFLALAPYYLEPGMMMFLGRISIVFALTGSFIVFVDERILIGKPFFWVGILLCVSGFIGLCWFKTNWSQSVSWLGIAMITGHALTIAVYSISIRYFMSGIDPWVSFPVICFYTSPILVVMMFLMGEPAQVLEMSSDRLVVLAVSSIIGIALGHVFYYYALHHIGVAICSGIALCMPFLTTTGSYWIFGERLNSWQWISGVVLLSGAGFLLWEQRHIGTHQPAVTVSSTPELEEITSVCNESTSKHSNQA